MNTNNEVPEEVLELIFRSIRFGDGSWCNVALTCKTWRRVAVRVFHPHNPDPNLSLWRALKREDHSVLRRLISQPSVDPSICNNSAIIYACRKGLLEVVRKLLTHPSVDPNARNSMPLKEAARCGHTDVVRVLLMDRRTNGHAEAARIAYNKRHTDVTELILNTKRCKVRDLGAGVNCRRGLSRATEVMQFLLYFTPRHNDYNYDYAYKVSLTCKMISFCSLDRLDGHSFNLTRMPKFLFVDEYKETCADEEQQKRAPSRYTVSHEVLLGGRILRPESQAEINGAGFNCGWPPSVLFLFPETTEVLDR
ncbi:ankyrin repeat protein [Planoprotostelium fungivorum]|uniref:Ankyrin repeat protein n=1 Tax=Planoprotostelium fungivorum TaxID=1890364 RepID=A0A2P6MZP0_9EUKA|nr:ankyrin repeat protein [Planoprotostelium fungivorum]